ncbi:MAG TPA: hypothetical protein EYH42_08530 [Sulfurovum sp.]|nr:hypothetical protein [Sulfurovum sp.]
MTAPLLQTTSIENINTLQTISLRTSVYQLLDAIDDNNIEQVEISLSKILQNNIPEITIRLFYNYAEVNEKIKVCEYLKIIIMAMYNINRKEYV